MARMIFARVVVAVLIGLAFGYAIGRSTAADAARGRDLTVKEYIADFENHKKELIDSGVPMVAAVIIGMMMVVAAFGVYALLVYGTNKLLAKVDRRRDFESQPGTPPPW